MSWLIICFGIIIIFGALLIAWGTSKKGQRAKAARQASAQAQRQAEMPYSKHQRRVADIGRVPERHDDGFDAAGFAVGMATGIPLSPVHGFSTGAMLGAALHSEPQQSSHIMQAPADYTPPAPTCDTSSSSSSSDVSSPSPSCDSGGGSFSGC